MGLEGLLIWSGVAALCGWYIPRLIEPWCRSRHDLSRPALSRPDQLFIAAMTTLVVVVLVARTSDIYASMAFCLLGVALVALALIDIRTYRLPREISYGTLGLGAPLLAISAIVHGNGNQVWRLVIGAGSAVAVIGGLYVASRGGLGDGDVRLSPLLGAYLGWISPQALVGGLMMSFVFGAVYGVTVMIVTKADRRTALPFGPFMALGTILAIGLPTPFTEIFSMGIFSASH